MFDATPDPECTHEHGEDVYQVNMYVKEDEVNCTVMCFGIDELLTLVQSYDREKYTLTHVELMDTPLVDPDTFIRQDPNLEFGKES